MGQYLSSLFSWFTKKWKRRARNNPSKEISEEGEWVRMCPISEEESKNLEAASKRFMQTQAIHCGPIVATMASCVEFYKDGKLTDKRTGIVIVRHVPPDGMTNPDLPESFEGIPIIPLFGSFGEAALW